MYIMYSFILSLFLFLWGGFSGDSGGLGFAVALVGFVVGLVALAFALAMGLGLAAAALAIALETALVGL